MAWPDTDWSISLLNKSDNKVQGWINPKNVRESVCGGGGEKGGGIVRSKVTGV